MTPLFRAAGIAVLCLCASQVGAASYNITAQGSSDGNLSLLQGDAANEINTLQGAEANRYNATDDVQSVQMLYTAQFYIQGHQDGTSPSTAEQFRAFCVQFDQYVVVPALDSGQSTSYDQTTTHLNRERRDALATLRSKTFLCRCLLMQSLFLKEVSPPVDGNCLYPCRLMTHNSSFPRH